MHSNSAAGRDAERRHAGSHAARGNQTTFAGKVYRPVTAIIAQFDDGDGNSTIAEAFNWYSEIFAAEDWNWAWFSMTEEWAWWGARWPSQGVKRPDQDHDAPPESN